MFIEIRNFQENESDLDKCESMSNIIRSHQRGNHIIYGNTNIFKSIVKNSDNFSSSDRASAQQICDSIREYRSLSSSVHSKLVVDFNENTYYSTSVSGQQEIRTPWRLFLEQNNCAPCILITENKSDFDLYLKIGEFFVKKNLQTGSNIKFSHHPGGGSQTFNEFDNLHRKKIGVLCIVDSDKKHPKMPVGSTAKPFTSPEIENYLGCKAKIIDSTEAENLLPTQLIKHIVSRNYPNKIDSFDSTLKAFDGQQNNLSFFDMKNGISLKKMIELDNKYGAFWSETIEKIPEMKRLDCFKSKVCHDCGECPSIEGVGPDLLQHAEKWFQCNNIMQAGSWLNEHLHFSWNEIGSHLWTWGSSLSLLKGRC